MHKQMRIQAEALKEKHFVFVAFWHKLGELMNFLLCKEINGHVEKGRERGRRQCD